LREISEGLSMNLILRFPLPMLRCVKDEQGWKVNIYVGTMRKRHDLADDRRKTDREPFA